LIVVGDGGDADEALARRRLQAGGRLCHILTRGVGDPRVKVQAFDNDGRFYWQPPDASYKMSALGERLGGTLAQAWTKEGPDAICLPDDHKLVVAQVDGSLQHVHMLNGEGEAVIEMSGWVVVCPNMELATTAPVEVHNMHLKPMGTFTARRMFVGSMVSYTLLLAHFSFMILAERLLQGQTPWWRLLSFFALSTLVAAAPMIRLLGFALCGDDLNMMQTWGIAFAGVGVAGVAAISTRGRLSESMCAFTGYACFSLFLGLVYYQGRHRHPSRNLCLRIAWLTCLVVTTAGCMGLIAASILTYVSLIASNQAVLAAIFLPTVTASAELGLVKLVQVAHTRLVCMRPHQEMTSGDQLHVVLPFMVMTTHACCEAARFLAIFIGTVADGGFSWIGSALGTFCFNLMMRSGWTSFLMFHFCKSVFGRRFAARRFAPSALNKLHNHSKVLGGYLRFVPIASLVTARALAYAGADLHPAFNSSAAIALLVVFLLEILEDLIVLYEVIPASPLPEDFLKHVAGNLDPHQLFAVELRPCDHSGPAASVSWHASSVVPAPAPDVSDLLEWRPALKRKAPGGMKGFLRGAHSLRCGLALHGLREIPWPFQVAFAWAVTAAVCLPIFPAMLGAGYMLGLNDPCLASEVWSQYFWQESPHKC